MPQFAATIKHIGEGVKGFTISAAVKNIEGWEKTLESVETPGAKGIIRDLEKLKKLIQSEEIDGEAVKKLVGALGEGTVKMASRAEGKKAEQMKELGEALTGAAK
ncbi:hypothetical protein [Falsiroseomonas tokyonensis]|uniref:Uncharacterized protein n=1 Tax=Falsiroseomonas tokyonensis TaxID=430521 RepID=A0ABV7C4R0_9PROT|nr:hypothetical protein [Falsiroseomonas tokyonensis]MBU8541390.1 hypothetical protein [Falsiroseomonas tokyonensis]